MKKRRVLLKISGEALGTNGTAIDPAACVKFVEKIREVAKAGIQVAIVIGGGNILRGSDAHKLGLSRVPADEIGMISTVINGLLLKELFLQKKLPCALFSAFPVGNSICLYNRRCVLECLEKGMVVIFVGGTGHPFFTTDTGAALRALEIQADLLLKATKVDGVYSADPKKNPKATRFEQLTYTEVLEKELAVMDGAAIDLCRKERLPIRVIDFFRKGALKDAVLNDKGGTLITGEKRR